MFITDSKTIGSDGAMVRAVGLKNGTLGMASQTPFYPT